MYTFVVCATKNGISGISECLRMPKNADDGDLKCLSRNEGRLSPQYFFSVQHQGDHSIFSLKNFSILIRRTSAESGSILLASLKSESDSSDFPINASATPKLIMALT